MTSSKKKARGGFGGYCSFSLVSTLSMLSLPKRDHLSICFINIRAQVKDLNGRKL